MGIFSEVKNKTVSNAKHVVGYDQIATGTKENYNVFKNIIKYNLTKNTDENAEPEFYLPKEQVIDAQKGFKKLVVLFLLLFFIGLLYSLGNFIRGNWGIGFVASAFTLLCLSLCFRYHFWLYQIKTRTLGVTFANYYQAELKNFFMKKKTVINKDEK